MAIATLASLTKLASEIKDKSDARYVAQVEGKGLSDNNFTTEEKTKLGDVPTPSSIVTTNQQGKISANVIPDSIKALETCADIDARDALTGNFDGRKVLVLDASDDETVTSGFALYVYSTTNSSWTKIAESESMDVSIDWSDIQNVPSLEAADATILKQADIVDALNSTSTTAPLSANQGKALKTAIDAISVPDVVDNLTTDDATKTLSAKQGKALKALYDGIDQTVISNQDIEDMIDDLFDESEPEEQQSGNGGE